MGQQSTNRTSTAINSGTTVTTSTSLLSSTAKAINTSTAQSLSATAYFGGQLVANQVPLGVFFIDAVLARLWTTMETFRLGNKKFKMLEKA
jgi:hypothetical protein